MSNSNRNCRSTCCNTATNYSCLHPNISKLRPYAEVPTCSVQNCKFFGEHDEPYFNQPYCGTKRRKNMCTLGIPVGSVHSPKFIVSNMDNMVYIMTRFACLLKAFAKVYILPEGKWTSDTIDQILDEGELLYSDSLTLINEEGEEEEEGENENEVENENEAELEGGQLLGFSLGAGFENLSNYTDDEYKIKREFDMDGCVFSIDLEQYHPMAEQVSTAQNNLALPPPTRTSTTVAATKKTETTESTLKDLWSILLSFYSKATFGLLKVYNYYLLIWRNQGVYFALDLFGRRLSDLRSEFSGEGYAIMLCLKSLENIVHLVQNLSNFSDADTFSIREINLVRLTRTDGQTVIHEVGIRQSQFEVINWDYAFLTSNLHLTLDRYSLLRSRSAFSVGLVFLLATKIDHPATWSRSMLDKIICFGVNVYHLWLDNCIKHEEAATLDSFPSQLQIGQFWVIFQLINNKYTGVWKCVPNSAENMMEKVLRQAFYHDGYTKLLLQISQQMYALWKQNECFYLFDPYLHRVNGRTVGAGEPEKVATLRMFCRFQTFTRVLNEVILQSTQSTQFFLHSVKVRSVSYDYHQLSQLDMVEMEYDNMWDEIVSLNENICFDVCKDMDLLGQSTDFEEEEEDIPVSEYLEQDYEDTDDNDKNGEDEDKVDESEFDDNDAENEEISLSEGSQIAASMYVNATDEHATKMDENNESMKNKCVKVRVCQLCSNCRRKCRRK